MKKVVHEPTTFLAMASSRAPTAWANMMLAAMVIPNTTPIIRKNIWFALEMAASAASPNTWLTQMALAEPLIDCDTLTPITGNANRARVLPTGPLVRSGLGRAARLALSFGATRPSHDFLTCQGPAAP